MHVLNFNGLHSELKRDCILACFLLEAYIAMLCMSVLPSSTPQYALNTMLNFNPVRWRCQPVSLK